MALVKCYECGGDVSTEAAACPKCGAPPKQAGTKRPVAVVPPSLPQGSDRSDETIYSDNRVTVTTTRVIIGTTTYALRNITSVKPIKTRNPIFGILVLLAGLALLRSALSTGDIVAGGLFGVMGAGLVACAIWLLKPVYHILIASASGEAKALTSRERAYVQRIVDSVNDAIVKYR